MRVEKWWRHILIIGIMVSGVGCATEEIEEEFVPGSHSRMLFEEEAYDEEVKFILKNLKCPPVPALGLHDIILGKWQVVRGWYSPEFPTEKTDRSCDKIFYEFLPDNKLIVSGDKDHPLAGENTYLYSLYEQTAVMRFSTPGANLYINDKYVFLAIPYPSHMDIIELSRYSLSEKMIRVD